MQSLKLNSSPRVVSKKEPIHSSSFSLRIFVFLCCFCCCFWFYVFKAAKKEKERKNYLDREKMFAICIFALLVLLLFNFLIVVDSNQTTTTDSSWKFWNFYFIFVVSFCVLGWMALAVTMCANAKSFKKPPRDR